MAYRRPAETRKDRINQAVANYSVRTAATVPVIKNVPQPTSGRYFIWYGWKNARRSRVFPSFVSKINHCNVVTCLKMVIDVKKKYALEVTYVWIIWK